MKVKTLSRVRPSATPWASAFQAPPSMGFSRQEYWSRVPLLSSNTFTSSLQPQYWNFVKSSESITVFKVKCLTCERHSRDYKYTWYIVYHPLRCLLFVKKTLRFCRDANHQTWHRDAFLSTKTPQFLKHFPQLP